MQQKTTEPPLDRWDQWGGRLVPTRGSCPVEMRIGPVMQRAVLGAAADAGMMRVVLHNGYAGRHGATWAEWDHLYNSSKLRLA